MISRFAAKLTDGPLSVALALAYGLLLAAWAPQYLSWPWWNDLDHFATVAMAWDAGRLPYRDMHSFQFPGEYYLFWAVGKVCGWGRTSAVYAVDAALLFALGAALAGWSRRRFGRASPGVVGYGLFLAYYLGLGLNTAAQRDWHAALSTVLGLFAAEAIPGRWGRATSALGLAVALSIRPYFVLLVPAFVLALDESSRPARGPWSLSRKAVLEWGAWLAGFVALAFAPLVAAGVFDDFLRSLREIGPNGPYNRITAEVVYARSVEQVGQNARVFGLAASLALLAAFPCPGPRRSALTWLAAFLGASCFKPINPVAHAYLTHTLYLVASVLAALLVETVLKIFARRPTLRLALVGLVIALEFSTWPRYVSARRSVETLTKERTFEFPRKPPDCGPMYQFYSWDEYRSLILHLRRTLPRGVRVANMLRGLLAVTGPLERLPVFPGESLSWFQYSGDRPELVEAYLKSLRDDPDPVVVWAPTDELFRDSFVPRRLTAYVKTEFARQAQFGRLEVWRRRPQPGRTGASD